MPTNHAIITALTATGDLRYVTTPSAIQNGQFVRGFWGTDEAGAYQFPTRQAAEQCAATIQQVQAVTSLRIVDPVPHAADRPCNVAALTAWETELWGRYGRVFFPQSAEGYRVFAQQRRTA